MKLLLFFAPHFSFETHHKSVERADDDERSGQVKDAVVAFIHVEGEDQEKASKVETKLVKNLKWLAGKFSTRTVVLHSFAHLSESVAPFEFSKELLDKTKKRLEAVDYTVETTPFGYFNAWTLSITGESLGRVFKSF